MFESTTGRVSPPEVIARFDAKFARLFPAATPESAAVLERICSASRAENQAAGERLVAIGELDMLRLREYGERESWATDTWDSISAEIAAALGISQALASSYLNYSRAMRNRLPKVGSALVSGDISYSTFQTIVFRTDLIDDAEVMAAVDAALALRVQRWPTMTRGRLTAAVDRVVARADRDAVRRRREHHAGREFSIWDGGDGLPEVHARLFATDAHAVDARLNALAGTVCESDPRTLEQRRADAMGALAAGAERLHCGCGQPTCSAGARPVPSPVVIHVVANQSTVDGASPDPGSIIGTNVLIPAELVAQLVVSSRLRPLVHPGDAPPERGYVASRALADFVRCRDLTCRFPGCDRPATETDLDHTVPYSQGGATHASNLKCLCRQHHLIKTFWGWQDQQLPDGTVIWRSPSGHTYVTTPASALLFPSLCAPTGEIARPRRPDRLSDRFSDRAAMMPQRRRTRASSRAEYIAAERRHNRTVRQARQSARETNGAAPPPTTQGHPPDPEPPPF